MCKRAYSAIVGVSATHLAIDEGVMNLVREQWYDEFPVSIVPSYYHHTSAVWGGGRFEGVRFVRETRETCPIGRLERPAP